MRENQRSGRAAIGTGEVAGKHAETVSERAEPYSREAGQAILAIEGMDRVTGFLDE